MPRHVLLVVTIAIPLCWTLANAAESTAPGSNDWPGYNRTLTAERFATLDTINTRNVGSLKVVCSYDLGRQSAFESDLVEVDHALFGTTGHDTFSIDPDTCKENWRAHEDFAMDPAQANRGLAWADGRVFRGTDDGRVLAYEARSGKRLWATTIADAAKGEAVQAAPIAWNGLVFIGNGGGDNKGVKGRMYALDANDGHVVWEFYLVPKAEQDFARGAEAPLPAGNITTSWKNAPGFPISGGTTAASYTLDPASGLLYVPVGNPAPAFAGKDRDGDNLYTGSIVVLDAKSGAYQRHVQIVKRDFHGRGVTTPPLLFTSKGNHGLMAIASKDGFLHVVDPASGHVRYSRPMTRAFNNDTPITPKGTRFCPGTQGGANWNGPAFDPANNLLFTGEVDWCTTVRSESTDALTNTPVGHAWTGSPDGFGKMDDPKSWGGWMTASDADSGLRKWQVKTPFPLLGGITPTAGGLLFFGDIGGNFYAYAAASGKKLWSHKLDGAIAGGVITYDSGAGQRIAVAAGMTSPTWPTPKVDASIVVFGLESPKSPADGTAAPEAHAPAPAGKPAR